MRAIVTVMLKRGVLDPQGRMIEKSLKNLGFSSVMGVRVKRQMEIELNCRDNDDALQIAEDMCKKMLVNEVIEEYVVDIVG